MCPFVISLGTPANRLNDSYTDLTPGQANGGCLSPLDKAYALLMYPPRLPEGMSAVKAALEITGVPDDVREQILRQTSPTAIRALFTNWNKEFWKRNRASGRLPKRRLLAGLVFYMMVLLKVSRLI